MSESKKEVAKAPSAPVAKFPQKKPKVKDPRFKGHQAADKSSAGKVVVIEKVSRINMSMHNGTQLVKGEVVKLSQEDIDLLNTHHVEGYEDDFFEDMTPEEWKKYQDFLKAQAKRNAPKSMGKPESAPQDEDELIEDEDEDQE